MMAILSQKRKQNIVFAAKQSILPMFISGKKFVHVVANLKNDKTNVEEYLYELGFLKINGISLYVTIRLRTKKTAISGISFTKPYIIMFDEPFDYCDKEYIETFLNILEEEKRRSYYNYIDKSVIYSKKDCKRYSCS